MKTLLALSISLSLSLSLLGQTGDPRKDYPLSDPRNPDCPCHELQKKADEEYERLQKKERKEKEKQKQETNNVQKDNDHQMQELVKLEVKEIAMDPVKTRPDSVKVIRDNSTVSATGGGGGSYGAKVKKKKRFGQKLAAKWQKKRDKMQNRDGKYKIKRWTCFDW